MKIPLIPLAVLLALGGTALADDGNAPKDQPAKFKITTKRADAAVEVQGDKDQTVFDVKKPVRHRPCGDRAGGRRMAEGRGAAITPERSGELPGLDREGDARCCGVQSERRSAGASVEGRQGGRSPGREKPLLDGIFAWSATTANRQRRFR